MCGICAVLGHVDAPMPCLCRVDCGELLGVAVSWTLGARMWLFTNKVLTR